MAELFTAGGAIVGVVIGFWLAGGLNSAAKSASLSVSSQKSDSTISRKAS